MLRPAGLREPDELARQDGGPASRVDGLHELLRERLLSSVELDLLPPPTPLMEGLLTRDTLAALFGRPGTAKSLVAMDWACCVATGSVWQTRPVKPGAVLYIAAEGTAGLSQRKRAWEAARSLIVGDGLRWLPMSVNLLDSEWSEALARLAVELRPVLVVVDTLSRSMAGGDENAPKDMGRLVDSADRLRATSRATVLLVHHSPKDGEASAVTHR